MHRDLVPVGHDRAGNIGRPRHLLAQQEERRPHTAFTQQLQEQGGGAGRRAVVERQGHVAGVADTGQRGQETTAQSWQEGDRRRGVRDPGERH